MAEAEKQPDDELTALSWHQSFVVHPWTISAIARESMLYANEYRPEHDITVNDLYRLADAFAVTDVGHRGDALGLALTSIFNEQFPYQESEYEEVARTYALYGELGLGPQFDWTEVFGMPLAEAVRAAFVLHVWVFHYGGRFDPAILDLPDMQEVFEHVAPREQVEAIARQLTTTIEEAKAASSQTPILPPELQRYAFNPLAARPLVDLGDKGIWAPQAMFVYRAFHPINLYYRGWAAWGSSFAHELGLRHEVYVGRQLRLAAEPTALHDEIVYGTPEKKSIDWFWVTDQAVVLFECKSARLALEARAGAAEKVKKVVYDILVKARIQLDKSEELIQQQTPPFDQFPNDRPIIGVVVTAEPFYLANSTMAEYGQQSRIPSITMSLRELEHWVCLPPDVAVSKLLEVLQDPDLSTWSFSQALDQALGDLPDLPRNPILDEAYKHYDFLDPQLSDLAEDASA